MSDLDCSLSDTAMNSSTTSRRRGVGRGVRTRGGGRGHANIPSSEDSDSDAASASTMSDLDCSLSDTVWNSTIFDVDPPIKTLPPIDTNSTAVTDFDDIDDYGQNISMNDSIVNAIVESLMHVDPYLPPASLELSDQTCLELPETEPSDGIRDLKPENILLNDEMHIQITDFGSAKIFRNQVEIGSGEKPEPQRKNSFVGTAQYVSPEILTSKQASISSDLWALGCILYQFLSGEPPFRGGHEYQIFQKITKLEYEFPDGFHAVAQDLVQKLLVIEPAERLGSDESGGFEKLKLHPFFTNIDWDQIHEKKPPDLMPYLPATASNPEQCWSTQKTGLDDKRIGEIITANLITEEERKRRLDEQASTNKYHKYVEGNLILKQGLIDKRKGLFARRRMFLLTEGPHLYYVDPMAKVLKGQIPWSKELRTEQKNFKIFFIHTPNRTYYLEEPQKRAEDWCKEIDKTWRQYFS